PRNRAGAEPLPGVGALLARAVDARERGRGVRRERGHYLRFRRAAFAVVELRRVGELFGGFLRVGRATSERTAEPPGDAASDGAGSEVTVDAGVDERNALGVGAVDVVGAQDGALDRHGGVRVDEALHAGSDIAG